MARVAYKNENELRKENVKIRLTETEKEELLKESEEKGFNNLASYIRFLILRSEEVRK